MALIRIKDEMVNTNWIISVTKNKERNTKTDVTLMLPDGRLMVLTLDESAYWVTSAIENALKKKS